MRKLVAAALVAGSVVVIPSTHAFACDDCGPGSSGSREGKGGVVVVTEGRTDPGSPGGSPGPGPGAGGEGPSHPIECHVFSQDGAAGGNGDEPNPLDPSTIEPGTAVWQVCIDSVTYEVLYTEAFTWGAGQVTPYVPPQVLAQHARAQLVLPEPIARTWPASAQQVVRIPTWLHVDNFTADSRSATVGGVTATVQAEPVQVTWDMGGGQQVECATGGAVYVPSASDDGQSDCSFSFEHTSAREPGQVFGGSVSISWHLSWTSNVGPGGDLGTVTQATPIDWRVSQIQSVITNEGNR